VAADALISEDVAEDLCRATNSNLECSLAHFVNSGLLSASH
jgi:hypothetical protein